MTTPLSIPLWLPFAAALVAALIPNTIVRRTIVLSAMAGVLGWAASMIVRFDPDGGQSTGGVQNITDETWISSLGIHYKLGLDGLNVALIVMAALLFFVCTVWAITRDWQNEGRFLLWIGLAQSAVFGALMSQDLVLFVLFFDLMLIPFLFLTLGWGPEEIRRRAIVKLFIYTLAGSLLMLAAAAATGVLSNAGPDGSISFAFSDLQGVTLPEGSQDWIFLCFAAAFLVKMPAFPLHGWMPDGYRAMPLPVLALFSGVLSKVAAYAFLKVALPLFPDAAERFQYLLLVIALLSILYGSIMAFTVTNARLVLGYSSVAQLGFITLGIAALNGDGAQGALLQSVNHGLVVAPAFMIVAYLGARAGGSEDIRDMGGIAFRAPILAVLFLVVALATLAMPGTSNFVGEFLILIGAFRESAALAIIASIGVVLASVYALRLFITSMHNRVGEQVDSRELTSNEAAPLAALVVVILALAVVPQFLLKRSEPAVTGAVAAVAPDKASPSKLKGVQEVAPPAEEQP